MYKDKTIACVIPARLASTRFPRKILALLGGKPLVQHAYEAAKASNIFDDVVIAVDSEETLLEVKRFGGKALMTSLNCINGTERLLEVKARGQMQADVWVNWQADEPFIHRALLEDLLQGIEISGDIWTLRKTLHLKNELEDPNIVKVVVNARQQALYFSRSQIPYLRNTTHEASVYKHIGLYAYSAKALDMIGTLSECMLEKAEMLEQLRFLYHGLNISVYETSYETIGIDLPEHLQHAEQYLQKQRELELSTV